MATSVLCRCGLPPRGGYEEPAAALALSAAPTLSVCGAVQKTPRTTLSSCLSLLVQFFFLLSDKMCPFWFVVKGGASGTITHARQKTYKHFVNTTNDKQMCRFKCELYDTHYHYAQLLCLYIFEKHHILFFFVIFHL